jgi:DNA-binding IclR family transcriptional regulator
MVVGTEACTTGLHRTVLSRAVQIFDVFGPDQKSLRVSEISARTGLHIATVSRLVAELVDHGLLARNDDRSVRIGMRMWELATRASPILTLRDAALPFMEDVHAVVGNHVQLGVLEGDDVLFVERLSARNAAITYTHLGGRLPATFSTCGLVMLAFGQPELAPSALERLVANAGPNAIGAPEELRSQLATIRRDGFALCRGRINKESMGIAVPVRGVRGEVVGALGVVLAVDAVGESVIPLLLAASRGITRALRSPLASLRPVGGNLTQ